MEIVGGIIVGCIGLFFAYQGGNILRIWLKNVNEAVWRTNSSATGNELLWKRLTTLRDRIIALEEKN